MRSGNFVSVVMGIMLFCALFLLLLIFNGIKVALLGALFISLPFAFGIYVGYDICQKSIQNRDVEKRKEDKISK